MYLPVPHAETDIPTLRQLIRDCTLGILTTAIPSANHPLIQSSHIPFLLDVSDESSTTELGRLRGHMARANPQAKAMIEALVASKTAEASSTEATTTRASGVLDQEVLVLFTSPVQHYITPKFYVETKPATGKTVPTWNYAAVQAYGRARVYFDAGAEETSAFLDTQIDALSRFCETGIMGYTGKTCPGSEAGDKPEPWSVSEAPESYTRLLKKAIIGVEIEIKRLEGKFKMSQEKPEGDRKGVVDGFRALGTEFGRDVADLVKLRGEMKAAKSS